MGLYDAIKPNKVGSALLRRAFDRYGRKVYTEILEKTDDREVARQLTVQVFSDLYSGMQKGKTTDAMELLLKEYTDKRIKWMLFSDKDLSDISSEMKEDEEFGAFANGDGKAVLEKLEKEDRKAAEDDKLKAMALEEDDEKEKFEDDDDAVLKRAQVTDPKKKKKVRGGLIALIIVLAVIGGWIGAGLLMRYGYINIPDLGYMWFNNNIYPMF